ncbi:hypothetical protein ACFL6S_33240, partial [Candidatus Poribacteria bacterium]
AIEVWFMIQRIPLVKIELIAKKIIKLIGCFVVLASLIAIVVGLIRGEAYFLGGIALLPLGIAMVFFAKMLSIQKR